MATYSYDVLGRMTGMAQGDTTASYTYDGAGLRQSKTVDGVTTSFVLDGMYVAAETSGETSTYYSRGVNLISRSTGESKDYYYMNSHGDVKKLVNSSGTVVVDYTYDAFGNQTGETEDSNPFRYAAEYWDSESGLIYLRARYYDSSVGAFTSEDPARDGLNWYVYCGGNPVNLIDPFGEDAIIITDTNAVNVGVPHGHTSALFQDASGIWYYFYWGDKEAFVQEITDNNAMLSLANLNEWLHNNTKWDGNAVYSGNYNKSTYIAGDFTESLSYVISISQNYKTSDYTVFGNNCITVSYEAVLKGKFYDGTPVRDTVSNSITVRPNDGYKDIAARFYNNKFTHSGYWKSINDQLWEARQRQQRSWMYSYPIQHDIYMLEKLYY